MRNKPFLLIGILLVVVGIASIIHPQFSYRVSHDVQQIGPAKIESETRKIIRLPLWFSIPIITIGLALVIGGVQKDRKDA
ncbi:MAG TPA: hypothetical protein VJN21_04540 [Candidatus Acidoferrales bacterium]|nr:hypothetical protein [Candidatus Acidoferrales bacterium]